MTYFAVFVTYLDCVLGDLLSCVYGWLTYLDMCNLGDLISINSSNIAVGLMRNMAHGIGLEPRLLPIPESKSHWNI